MNEINESCRIKRFDHGDQVKIFFIDEDSHQGMPFNDEMCVHRQRAHMHKLLQHVNTSQNFGTHHSVVLVKDRINQQFLLMTPTHEIKADLNQDEVKDNFAASQSPSCRQLVVQVLYMKDSFYEEIFHRGWDSIEASAPTFGVPETKIKVQHADRSNIITDSRCKHSRSHNYEQVVRAMKEAHNKCTLDIDNSCVKTQSISKTIMVKLKKSLANYNLSTLSFVDPCKTDLQNCHPFKLKAFRPDEVFDRFDQVVLQLEHMQHNPQQKYYMLVVAFNTVKGNIRQKTYLFVKMTEGQVDEIRD